MEDTMAVFIKNTTPYDQTFLLARKQTTDAPTMLNDVESSVVFPTYLKDSATGQVIETGFTELDSEIYNRLLEEVKLFADALKRGALIKYDEAPPESLKDSQLLEKARAEAEALRQRIAELEATVASRVAGKNEKSKVYDKVRG
jgi:hypothetical protein